MGLYITKENMDNNHKLTRANFEDTLKAVIKPVYPDPLFINDLDRRLSKHSAILIDKNHSITWLPFFIAAGLLSGTIVLWLLRRKSKKSSLD